MRRGYGYEWDGAPAPQMIGQPISTDVTGGSPAPTKLLDLSRSVVEWQSGLSSAQTHIWRAWLPAYYSLYDEFRGLLSDDELGRANSFRFSRHHLAFVTARALLRLIIGAYCAREARDVRFVYGAYKKPMLHPSHTPSRTLGFNMSHSADLLLLGVSPVANLGVDLEHSGSSKHVDTIVQEYLTQTELSHLAGRDKSSTTVTPLRYWVHKEAFLKAIGCGLTLSPKHVEVSFVGPSSSVIATTVEGQRVVMFGEDIPSHRSYVSALACDTEHPRLCLIRL
jgi:4'-phosphopantetheinyl transferase